MQNSITTTTSVNYHSSIRQKTHNVPELKRLQKNKHAVMKLMLGRHLKCRHIANYQSHTEIGKLLGNFGGRAIGRRAMIRIMQYLVEHGYLAVTKRTYKGRQTTNMYFVARKGAHYYNQHFSTDLLIDMDNYSYTTFVPKHSTDLSTKISTFEKNDTPPDKKRHTSYSDHNINKKIINTREPVNNLRQTPSEFCFKRPEKEVGFRSIGDVDDDDHSLFAQLMRKAKAMVAQGGKS